MRSNQITSNFFNSKSNFRFANVAVKKFCYYLLACTCAPLFFGSFATAVTPASQTIAQVISVGTMNRPDLKLGSKGNAVNELQAALKLLGFYDGAVNGEYDSATASAVSRFRQAADLKADGGVDTTVWQKLFPSSTTNLAASPQPPAPATTSTQFPIPTQTQNPNPNIMSVVQAPEPRPANPSPQATQRSTTSTTVRTTQNGTTRTTNTSRTTSSSTSKPSAPKKTTTTRSQSNRSSTSTRTTSRSSLPKFTQKPNFQYTAEGEPILRVGMRGEEVTYVQGRLRRLGYLKNQPDGDFGAETLAAVQALQKRFGLESDGVVGGATWDILLK